MEAFQNPPIGPNKKKDNNVVDSENGSGDRYGRRLDKFPKMTSLSMDSFGNLSPADCLSHSSSTSCLFFLFSFHFISLSYLLRNEKRETEKEIKRQLAHIFPSAFGGRDGKICGWQVSYLGRMMVSLDWQCARTYLSMVPKIRAAPQLSFFFLFPVWGATLFLSVSILCLLASYLSFLLFSRQTIVFSWSFP